MPTSQDTEITLGTGKMLTLFFGLVVLCAVFFGMGFSLGRSSVKPLSADLSNSPVAASSTVRPSAVKPTSTSSANASLYKAVERKDADAPAAPGNTTEQQSDTPAGAQESKPPIPDPVALPSANGYFVQVAAVSKQEDAQALVDALKKKQYPAFTANSPADKLFHVQVGPFSDIKDAEGIRAKLVSDGYNPILKK